MWALLLQPTIGYPSVSPLMKMHIGIHVCLLTELDEGVGPHSAVDALGVVGDDELPLQLIQEAEG